MSIRVRRDGGMHRLGYAFGLFLLGVVGLIFRDFALQWQPVPEMLTHRALLATLNAVVLCVGALALMSRFSLIAAWLLGTYLTAWVLILHGPLIAAKPMNVATWLGAAEITALALGSMAILPISSRTQSIFRVIFATCVAVFGISHFVYAEFTASLVPTWIPGRLFWAYATGAAHLAASISLFSGVLVRRSLPLLTAMLAIITIVVSGSKLTMNPGEHADWVALAISIALTGSAWIMRTALAGKVSGECAASRAPVVEAGV